MDFDQDETQWTPAARERYRVAAEAAVARLRAHVELVLARTGDEAEDEDYFDSADDVTDVLSELSDAEFDWSGSFPFTLDGLEESDDEDDSEEDDADDVDDAAGDATGDLDIPDGETGPVLTIEYRSRLDVRDEYALLAAGRAVYREAWPDDSDEDLADAVHDSASALGQLVLDSLGALASVDFMEESWGELTIGSGQLEPGQDEPAEQLS